MKSDHPRRHKSDLRGAHRKCSGYHAAHGSGAGAPGCRRQQCPRWVNPPHARTDVHAHHARWGQGPRGHRAYWQDAWSPGGASPSFHRPCCPLWMVGPEAQNKGPAPGSMGWSLRGPRGPRRGPGEQVPAGRGGGGGVFRSAVRGDLKPEATGACSEGGSRRKPDKEPPNTQGSENPTPPASRRPAATLPLSVLVPFLPCPQAPGRQPPKGSATSFFQPRAVLTRTAIR